MGAMAGNKQSFTQKIANLLPVVKIAIFAGLLLVAVGGVVVWQLARTSPPAPTPQPAPKNPPSTQRIETPPQQAITEDSKNDTPKEEQKQPDKPQTTGQAVTPTPQVSSPTPSAPAPTPTPSPARPSASNTGVPSGTNLSTYSGAASNNTSDVTYENVDFPTPGGLGYYTFSGNNLTLRNCYIHGGGLLVQGDNITIEHCTIDGGVSFSGTEEVTFRYNNVKDFSGDGIHVTSDSGQAANITLAYNFVHSPIPSCGDHADGLQVRGVATIAVTGNSFDMGPWQQVCGQDALNAAIFFESANGGNSNITVDGNYLNGAGITLRLNPGPNQKIINNRFGNDYKYGLVSNGASTSDIVQKTGNVMDNNGSAVNF